MSHQKSGWIKLATLANRSYFSLNAKCTGPALQFWLQAEPTVLYSVDSVRNVLHESLDTILVTNPFKRTKPVILFVHSLIVERQNTPGLLATLWEVPRIANQGRYHHAAAISVRTLGLANQPHSCAP